MSTDHRQTAHARVEQLMTLLRSQPETEQIARLLGECESLGRAIAAFHMEGIRFRMFNVDRLLAHGHIPVQAEASGLFADVRRELEAAGFHTRSHQAPG